MLSLPDEVQLDVLKCLNFNQLFSVRQTNFYFRNLINKCERGLARMKFEAHFLKIGTTTQLPNLYKFVELESGIFEITLNDQLKQKWQAAVDKSIPLFLYNSGPDRNFILIQKTSSGSQDEDYLLIFPSIPKNIKEMITARCWLEHLFKCAFRWSVFDCIFNPEMINILFDNDKSISLQFNIQLTNISATTKTENILNFSFNHLSTSYLNLNIFDDITEQHTNILFNKLIKEGNKFSQIRLNLVKIINEGNKFLQVWLNSSNFARLYDLIIEYIATARDCSKMAPAIILRIPSYTNHKLSERAEKVEIKQEGRVKYTNYQISNIYNSKVKFSFRNEEWNFIESSYS
uniref:F-box domain-containing protein n=1 Tax=Meloidogyne incognita TaxID=6306 RepID=A0A914M6B9_MELIC